MDSLFANKIAGSALLALLMIWVIGMIGDALVKPGHHAPANVQIAEASSAGPKKEEPADPPIATLLASADVGKGERVFKKCAACHTSEQGGKAKLGPNLWEIVNRDRGSVDGFSYSDAMAAAPGDWTYEHLYEFLKKPRTALPGTKMVFAGLSKPSDRANLIAYLRSLAATPAPLP